MSLHPFLESACRKLDHQAVVLSEDGDKLHEKDDFFIHSRTHIFLSLFLLRFFAMTSTINVAAATALMFAESAILLIQKLIIIIKCCVQYAAKCMEMILMQHCCMQLVACKKLHSVWCALVCVYVCTYVC